MLQTNAINSHSCFSNQRAPGLFGRPVCYSTPTKWYKADEIYILIILFDKVNIIQMYAYKPSG